MPSTRKQQQQRERQRARQEAATAAAERAARRRRLVAGIVLSVALFATVVAVVAATNEDADQQADATSTTTTDPLDPGGPPEPDPVEVPLPAAGAVRSGTVPCPPAEGSDERVTGFDAPVPMCLATGPDGSVDPAVDYQAVVHTSAGDLVYLLDTERAPETTNAFVVLARYGYFDGAPLDTVIRNGWAEVGGAFEGGGTPGSSVAFTLPTEAPEVGTIQTPGTLSMAPVPGSDGMQGQGGRFLIAVGDQAADLPARTTTFGLLLDGTDAFPAIVRAGTESGQPGAVITIEGIDITEGPAPS